MEAIITAATVLASYLNMAASAQGDYTYNAACEGGSVNRIEVYANDGAQLVRKLQHRYAYDASGRLVSNETLVWNADAQEWTPRQIYTYEYADGGYSLTLSLWDSLTRRYVDQGEKAVYHLLDGSVLAVDTYRRTSLSGDYERVSGILMMTPQRDLAAR